MVLKRFLYPYFPIVLSNLRYKNNKNILSIYYISKGNVKQKNIKGLSNDISAIRIKHTNSYITVCEYRLLHITRRLICMKKDISKVIIDGEEYTLSEDKKRIKGPEKDYEAEEFKKEKGKDIPFFAAPKESETDGKIYAFTTEEKFEEWLKDRKLLDQYKKDKELAKKFTKEKTPEDLEKIKKQQVKKVEEATEKYKKFLDKHKLKPDQHDEIQKVLEKHDPHYERPIHSLHLYDYTWWGGATVTLPGGYVYCYVRYPKYYPYLSWFGFDNRAESAKLTCGSYAYVYTDPYYKGARFYIGCNLAIFGFWWSYFGNSVSSAIVY